MLKMRTKLAIKYNQDVTKRNQVWSIYKQACKQVCKQMLSELEPSVQAKRNQWMKNASQS